MQCRTGVSPVKVGVRFIEPAIIVGAQFIIPLHLNLNFFTQYELLFTNDQLIGKLENFSEGEQWKV